MRAVLLPMPALMPSTASHCGIFHSPRLTLTMAPAGEHAFPQRTSFHFHPKQQNALHVTYSRGNVTKEGSAALWPSELFFQRFSAITAFRAACPLRFRGQNMVPAVLLEGYPRIDEKVPCSRPVNRYLINGVGRPERRYCLCTNTHCTFAHWLKASADGGLKAPRSRSAGGWTGLDWAGLGWTGLDWAGEEHSAAFPGLPASCHQLWVLKRCCHFIQRDLLGRRENLNTKHAVQKLVEGL